MTWKILMVENQFLFKARNQKLIKKSMEKLMILFLKITEHSNTQS